VVPVLSKVLRERNLLSAEAVDRLNSEAESA
jgi:hypothetical protein